MKLLDVFDLTDTHGFSKSWIKEEGQACAQRRSELMDWKDIQARLVEELHLNGLSIYTFEVYGLEKIKRP